MSTRQVAGQVGRGGGRAESARTDRGSVRPRDSLFHWCGTADAIRQAADRREKRVLLQAYFGVVAADTMPPAARFFSGLPFSPHDRGETTIDGSMVTDAIREITRVSADKLRALVAKCDGIGEAAAELFSGRLPSGLSVSEVADCVDELAAAPAETAPVLLRDLLARLSSFEVKYVVKLLVGELHLGLDQALIDDALAGGRAIKVKR